MMEDEKLFAWLDGELSDDETAAVAELVASDPALAAKAAAHRAMQSKLALAFAPIADQPVEPRGAHVVDLAQRRASKRGLPSLAQWAAMAATLLVGIVTGTMVHDQESPSVIDRKGALIASGNLDLALETQLASAPASSGPRIGLTFRNQAGSICRTFTDDAAQGVACRDGSDWRLRALVQGIDQPSGDFRMAAGMDPALGATLSNLIAGEPYDAGQEKAAMEKSWR